MLRLSAVKPSKEKVAKYEASASHFVPYKCHYNGDTILTHTQELIRVIKIKGFAFETADDVDIDLKKDSRNNLFKGMAAGNLSLYFHTVRRKEKGFPDGDMPDAFSARVNQEWSAKHSDDKTYINEHYLTIIRGQDKSGVAVLENMAKKLQHKTDKTAWENYMREAYDEVDEMTERLLNGFSNYGAEVLGIVETEDGVHSELLEFLARLVNAGYSQPIAVPLGPISNHLPISRMYFGGKSIEVHNPNGIKYAGMVSIKEYRPSTHAGVFDGFMQMPFELIISQSFSFIDKNGCSSGLSLNNKNQIIAKTMPIAPNR